MSGTLSHLVGLSAESAVARHYAARGLVLIETRWRCAAGEIDLVLREGETVVMVEVKKSRSHDRAALRITPRQRARLLAAAAIYLDGLPSGALTEMRFDVALVDGQGRVDILADAFAGG